MRDNNTLMVDMLFILAMTAIPSSYRHIYPSALAGLPLFVCVLVVRTISPVEGSMYSCIFLISVYSMVAIFFRHKGITFGKTLRQVGQIFQTLGIFSVNLEYFSKILEYFSKILESFFN